MKKLALFALLMVPAILLASGGHSEESRYLAQTGRESDFWPRVINFTIFASILYYLIANPVKDFFNGRKEEIAGQLKEIENKLQAAKEEKKEAQARLDESVNKAAEIVEDAKNEAKILASKIAESSENELHILEKQFDEKMALEERRALRDVIDELLSENITEEDITLSESKVVDIISKKVA